MITVNGAGLMGVCLVLGVMFFGFPRSAGAQAAADYPNRAIRVIVPSGPGGVGEVSARLIGDKLKDRWGQAFVVENRPGGNGVIGLSAVAQSKPDGYTLLVTGALLVGGPLLFKSFTVDQVNDFDPVIETFLFSQYLMAHPSAPFSTVQEFVTFAKANPAKVNFGAGVASQLDMVLLFRSLGIEVNYISYPGSGSLPQALLGNSVQVIMVSLPPMRALLADGRARNLAVVAAKRSTVTPDVPAIGQVYPHADVVIAGNGLSAPKGTPREIINRLNAEINTILKMPDIIERASSLVGAEVRGGSPADWKASQEKVFQHYKRAVQMLNVQPQ